jgi:hypothetical protein
MELEVFERARILTEMTELSGRYRVKHSASLLAPSSQAWPQMDHMISFPVETFRMMPAPANTDQVTNNVSIRDAAFTVDFFFYCIGRQRTIHRRRTAGSLHKILDIEKNPF